MRASPTFIRRLLRRPILGLALLGCAADEPAGPAAVAGIGDYRIDAEHVRDAARKLLDAKELAAVDSARRRQVLDALVGARLLALEAADRGLDTMASVRAGVADELCSGVLGIARQRWIEARVEITPAEVDSQYAEWGYGEEIDAAHILLRTPEDAEEVLAALAAGADYAELARTRSTHVGSSHRDGSMGFLRKFLIPEPLRRVMWGKPVGYVHHEPVRTAMGYHVLKVVDRRHLSVAEQEAAIRRFLTRKQHATVERGLQVRLQDEYGFTWRGNTAAALIRMGPEAASGDSVLARWRGGQLTVDDFRRRASGPDAVSTDTARVRKVVEDLANEDLLCAEGKARGLADLPEVRRRVETARIRLLGEALFATLGAQVTQASMRPFYEAHREAYRDLPRLTVREILVQGEATADSLHGLIAAGADMAQLARRHSLREETRADGGLWSGVDANAPGEATIYRRATAAVEGGAAAPGVAEGLLEPFALPTGGFSIVRIVDLQPGRVLGFEEAETAVKRDLHAQSMERLLRRLRDEHAHHVRIDAEALQALR